VPGPGISAEPGTGVRPAEAVRVGAAVPRRDYGWLRALGRRVLKAMRWRTEGEFADQPRLVVAIAPHSSNWDFVVGAAYLFVLGVRVAFIGKHTLFRGPLGIFMRWMGGIPIDRSQPEGVVDAMAAAFKRNEQLWLVIAPEGTRRQGAEFKSGFYRIAQAAGVPVFPVYLNYRRRTTGFLPVLAADMEVAVGVEQVRQLLHSHGARRHE